MDEVFLKTIHADTPAADLAAATPSAVAPEACNWGGGAPSAPHPPHTLFVRCLVLLAALLLVLALLLGRGVLVLLVLGDEVVHVRLGLGELHLVHALAGVPVKEGLAAEHGGELLSDALHDLLHAGGVAAEADRHLETFGGDVADRALHVVR